MLFKTLIDVTLGRLTLPLRELTGSLFSGEISIFGSTLKFRNQGGTATLTVITNADVGVAGGVAPLGADGLVPAAFLPSTSSGGSSIEMPIAIPYIWPGDPAAIPSGTVVLDGSEYLRADYPTAFARFRTRFGRPSSDLYFRVPDMLGRTPYGSHGGSVVYGSVGTPVRVHKINPVNRGSGYTPGTYAITLTGGTFSSAGTVSVVVEAGGTVERVDIVTGGSYSAIGALTAPSNCAIVIPTTSMGPGSGFTYDVAAVPITPAARAFSVRMTERGVGGVAAPKVVIGGAIGATAVAIMDDSGGTVREVVVTCFGTGTPTTVTFSGGGFSTPPTADIVFVRPPLSTGDYVGEELHQQLGNEVGEHTHEIDIFTVDNTTNGIGGGRYSNPPDYDTALNDGGLPFNVRAPGIAVLWVARLA